MSAYVSGTIGQATSSAAPGAGASINATLVPDAGVYSARIIIELSGTAETQLANLRLRMNGAVVIAALPTTPGPAPTVIDLDRIVTDAPNRNVDLQVVAAATAGAIYTTTVLLTRIS